MSYLVNVSSNVGGFRSLSLVVSNTKQIIEAISEEEELFNDIDEEVLEHDINEIRKMSISKLADVFSTPISYDGEKEDDHYKLNRKYFYALVIDVIQQGFERIFQESVATG